MNPIVPAGEGSTVILAGAEPARAVAGLAGEFAEVADAGSGTGSRKKRATESASIGAMRANDIFIDAPWKPGRLVDGKSGKIVFQTSGNRILAWFE